MAKTVGQHLLVTARRVVDHRWSEIERVARVLYARGRLDTAQIKTAAKELR